MSEIFNIPVKIKKAVLDTSSIIGPIILEFKMKNVILSPYKKLNKNVIKALASLFYDRCAGEPFDQVDLYLWNQKVISNKNQCWLMHGFIDELDKETRKTEIDENFKFECQTIFASTSEEGFEKYHKIYLKGECLDGYKKRNQSNTKD